MKKMIPIAIVYDFDGTLAPGNMQERDFIPAIGMTTSQFWEQVSAESRKHQADNILVYMKLMLDKADSAKVPVREKDFKNYGKNLPLFDGVLPYQAKDQSEKGWFDRINIYGKESGIKIEHFIVSSGIREMIQGSPIGKKFSAIYASSFFYDHHGIAKWPALAINYTTKTQYLFRINKDCLDVSDNTGINRYVPDSERKVPFSNIIYIGDGETDIPCFRLVKDRGGYTIAVYKPNTKGARNKLCTLMEDGRINFLASADYRNNSQLDKIIKSIIDKVQTDNYLSEFHVREYNKVDMHDDTTKQTK
jgi:hypothetical protein